MGLRIELLQLVLVLCVPFICAKISDKRLCADPKCEVPISEGVTTLKYMSPSRDVMTFGHNANVVIYSKEAGSEQSLWGVSLKGKRGYAPKRFIRENRKLFAGPLEYEVSTSEEIVEKPETEQLPSNEAQEQPALVQSTENVDSTVPNTLEDVAPKLEEAVGPKIALFNSIDSPSSQPEEPVQDPKVTLETIPNISAQDVPNPNVAGEPIPAPTLAVDEGKAAGEELPNPNLSIDQQKGEEVQQAETPKAPAEAPQEVQATDEIQHSDAEVKSDDEAEDYLDDEAAVEEEEEDDEEDDEDEEEVEEDPTEVVTTPGGDLIGDKVSNSDNEEATKDASEQQNQSQQPPAEEEKVLDTPSPPAVVEEIELSTIAKAPAATEDEAKQAVEEVNPEIPSISEKEQKQDTVTPTPFENMVVEEVKSETIDLPTPPSTLLGNFIHMNSEAGVPPTPAPPHSAYFDEQVIAYAEELENSTVQQINETETDKLTERQADAEATPPENVQQIPVDNEQPSVPEYSTENLIEPLPPAGGVPPHELLGLGMFEANVHPQENSDDKDQAILMEQRIPPIAQEQLNKDFYHYQNPSAVPPPPPPHQEHFPEQQYQQPPVENYDYYQNHVPPTDFPANPPHEQPQAPHEHHQHGHHDHGHHGSVEQVIPTEAPIQVEDLPPPTQPEETTTTENPVVDAKAEEVVPEEPVEAGPGFLEGVIAKTKSLLSAIDLTSMFKSGEKPTPPDSTIVGEYIEEDVEEEYCEKLSPDGCPKKDVPQQHHAKAPSTPPSGMRHPMISHRESSIVPEPQPSIALSSIDYGSYAIKFLDTLVSMTDLIICLAIVAATLLVFVFMHLCFTRSQKENQFVSKLNALERELMNSMKQNQLMDSELAETKHKLCSIEDNSFGSNDMVIAVRRQLEETEAQKFELIEQVTGLEKELETAAEAGLELNKMLSELLSNQQGSETIISSVEGLQSQLNEQQETILAINTLLAEKSRENSELQMDLSELRAKCEDEELGTSERVAELEEQLKAIEAEKEVLERDSEKKFKEAEKHRETIVKDLKRQLEASNGHNLKYEARIEALEESLKALEGSGNEGSVSKADMAKLMSVARVKTNLLAATKERDHIAEKLEGETRSKVMLEEQIKATNEEVQRLRTEYNQMEKEKLEANTKLGILSNYFKEKETQLQKELSVREAECMQQQGETTSTVEKIRAMQQEIQSLKSQNESFKNEIDVQEATHKTQILSLENRAHESWLATRQTERRLEESRSEAAVLRRKLTAMSSAGGNGGAAENGIDGGMANGTASSPLHMDGSGANAGSPIMPPMPGFMPPPPFMPAPMPHGFMPPPPFEMRPPPLGRLMSPPPPPGVNPGTRYSPHLMERGGRYTPDSRYDHFSPYETETDISPPHSPQPYRSRRSNGGSGTYNNNGGSHQQQQQQNSKKYGNKRNNNYSDRSDEFV